VLSSTAGAAEYKGSYLGEYQRAGEWEGRGYWKQRGGKHYLYYTGGSWIVSDEFGASSGGLYYPDESEEPPRTGWEYSGGSEWRSDPSLTLSCGSLAPCARVTVALAGAAARVKGSHQGVYLPTGTWSVGRPVYRAEGGERWYLLVVEGKTGWAIQETVTSTGAAIQGGRGTSSPGDPRAAGSVRRGVTRWRYVDSVGWPEGDISVTC